MQVFSGEMVAVWQNPKDLQDQLTLRSNAVSPFAQALENRIVLGLGTSQVGIDIFIQAGITQVRLERIELIVAVARRRFYRSFAVSHLLRLIVFWNGPISI
jgi:hypothetical protein